MNANGPMISLKPASKGPIQGILIVPLLAKPAPPLELVSRADKACGGAVARLLDVKATREEVGALTHTVAERSKLRVVVVSLGDGAKSKGADVRAAGAATVRWLVAERAATATVWADGLMASGIDGAVSEFILGVQLGAFRFGAYRKPDDKLPERIDLVVRGSDAGMISREAPALREVERLAQAVNYTRRLAHEPPNVLTPRGLADEARGLARECGLKFTLLGVPELRKLKMGGLLAVGGGALHPPCMVQLEYSGAPRARRRTVLVGKGITFDTGGYSIKPADGMDAMKMDMTGAATVLGVLRAAATLELNCNVTGVLAVAENAVSERAYRPGDILHMASGKTVEVTNTDAEGRLVLADALWYAQRKLAPTELIDLATLTGGVRVALGTAAAGLMSNNDELAGALGEAGRKVHERLWRLPLWDDYRELIKSTEADIKNSAGKRDAHAIVGGMFLREFVEPKTPWAHIDIAAVISADANGGVTGKGATGFGVRLLVEYLRARGG